MTWLSRKQLTPFEFVTAAKKRSLQAGDDTIQDYTYWGGKFEHPTKTWACATHKQFTVQAVAVAIAKAT